MQNNRLTLPVFLEFVEIKTKVASVFPMVIGFLWYRYAYGQLNWLTTLLFICAVLAFDMCTTAINNAMDYKKAVDMDYREQENVIGKNGLDYRSMLQIIFVLFGMATFFSLLLVWQTDLLLLPIGVLCFLIGIFYTFGPMPLSRLPLGEVFSGVTMGFGIFFLAAYIQSPSDFLVSSWSMGEGVANIDWYWMATIRIAMMSVPLVSLIANIMLANNICDYEQDVRNHRFTLVHYIGKQRAVTLYTILSLLPWGMWGLYLLLGMLPLWSLIGFLGLFPSLKLIGLFRKEQVKSQTFICSIKGFVLFSMIYALVLLLAIWI